MESKLVKRSLGIRPRTKSFALLAALEIDPMELRYQLIKLKFVNRCEADKTTDILIKNIENINSKGNSLMKSVYAIVKRSDPGTHLMLTTAAELIYELDRCLLVKHIRYQERMDSLEAKEIKLILLDPEWVDAGEYLIRKQRLDGILKAFNTHE